jgi:hypothetical protein
MSDSEIKGWLIATAFIFLVFGIVLGHYTA